MAQITFTEVRISDQGGSAHIDARVSVLVDPDVSYVLLLTESTLGLSPAQITNLTNTLTAIRSRAEQVAQQKAVIGAPPPPGP